MTFKTIPNLTIEQIERFASKFIIDDGGCWLWQAAKSVDGYGVWGISPSQRYMSHRVAFKLMRGDIPLGMEIDHLCKVRNCINPEHLEAVVPEENIKRSEWNASIKAFKERCIRGHLLSESTRIYHEPKRQRTYRICIPCETYRKKERRKAKRLLRPKQ